MMKKLMLVGSTSTGKTTLTQALYGQPLEYRKTQALEYSQYILDTPGEYVENRRFYCALISASSDYDVIALLHDSTSQNNQLPPGFASMFSKEVIGIITKTDCSDSNPAFSRQILEAAGAHRIFEVSAVSHTGLDPLKEHLKLPCPA